MADKFPLQVTSATLASGDNTIVASATGQAIKVYQLIVAAGSNADAVTLKFTLAGTAQTAIVAVIANDSAILPNTGAAWANCDPGTTFVANSGTTTTKLTAYTPRGRERVAHLWQANAEKILLNLGSWHEELPVSTEKSARTDD